MTEQEKRISELKLLINQRESEIDFLLKRRIPFSIQGYKTLIVELRSWHEEYAKVKADVALYTINQIYNN